MREKAKPFIDWLEQASEEEEDDDDEAEAEEVGFDCVLIAVHQLFNGVSKLVL